MPERLECEVPQKERSINPLTFTLPARRWLSTLVLTWPGVAQLHCNVTQLRRESRPTRYD